MLDQQVGAFTIVAALLVITPGLDMALVTKNALRHGQRAAFMTALGVNFGVFLWTAAAAMGIALLDDARPRPRLARLSSVAGAAYLRLPRAHDHSPGLDEREDELGPARHAGGDRDRWRRLWRSGRGALSNLLNPKVAVFYASLLPSDRHLSGRLGLVEVAPPRERS